MCVGEAIAHELRWREENLRIDDVVSFEIGLGIVYEVEDIILRTKTVLYHVDKEIDEVVESLYLEPLNEILSTLYTRQIELVLLLQLPDGVDTGETFEVKVNLRFWYGEEFVTKLLFSGAIFFHTAPHWLE